MIETSFKLSPVFQPDEDEDYSVTLYITPLNDPNGGSLNYVQVAIHGGEGGSLKELASVELTPDEAEEIGSVLKVVARPDAMHDSADLLNAGKSAD